MTPPLLRKGIQKLGAELAIAWIYNSESYLALEFLRRHCPCAACGGEPDVLGQVALPTVTYNDRSFDLTSWQTVGGYAIQPRWADGHSTGLYSYKYLHRLEQIAQS